MFRVRSIPWVAVVGASLATVGTFHPQVHALFVDRPNAEFGRWVTGSFAHASAQHWLGNVVAFFVLVAWRERRCGSRRIAIETLLLAVGVALGVRVLQEGWISYQGLSGVVYGHLGLLLWAVAPDAMFGLNPRRYRWLTLGVSVALVGKTGLEWVKGDWLWRASSLEESLGVAYYPSAHVAGLVVAGWIALSQRWEWRVRARSTVECSSPVVRDPVALNSALGREPSTPQFGEGAIPAVDHELDPRTHAAGDLAQGPRLL